MEVNTRFLKLNRLLVVWFFIVTTASSGIAQQVLEGVVMDPSQDIPVEGASVEIKGQSNGTVSGADGSFSIPVNLPLPVKLIVTYVGYELREITIDRLTDNLLVSMNPGISIGQEVVVTVSRKREKMQEAPSAVDLIEQPELLADAVSNPFLSLRNKVGLDVTQTGVNSGHITLRGRSAVFQTETFVMSDYRNLILPGLGTLSYGQQPIDPIDLERIEIVKGPGSALYGPGVEAGIVHFISKSPFDKQGTTVSLGTGTRNLYSASLRHAGILLEGKLGYKITGYYRTAKDWEIDPTDPQERTHLQRFKPRIVSSLTDQVVSGNVPDYEVESMGVTGTIAYRPDEETLITTTAGWSVGKGLFRTSQGEGYTAAPRPFAQARVQSGGWFGQAFWSYQGGKDGKTFLYASGLTAITESHQVEGQLQYNFDFGESRINYVFGADYRLNTIDTKGTVHGRWENQDDYGIVGVYGQAKMMISSDVDFVGAARFDHFTALDKSSTSPRLGLVYKPSPLHTARLTFNHAVGAPTAINLYADLPLADQGNFQYHLLGGADPISFDNTQTTSLIPGVGNYEGIGVDLQGVYSYLTKQLAEQQLVSDELMQYLEQMEGQIDGFSTGVLSQAPLARTSLELSTSDMYEFGYQGLIKNRLALTVDLYYNKRQNILSSPIQASPFVVQPELAEDLANSLMGQLDTNALAALGETPSSVTSLYSNLARVLSEDQFTGEFNNLGFIRSDQTPTTGDLPTVDLAYYNISQIDYFGVDLGMKYYISSALSAFGNITWLSKVLFEDVPIGRGLNPETTDFSLNVPRTKVKMGIELVPELGWNAFLMMRYQSKWESINGLLWSGPVDAFTLVDAGLGYTFDNNVRVNMTVTNLFQEDYRAIYGAPKIGRQVIVKTYFDF